MEYSNVKTRGLLVAVEGPDQSGKTTQAVALCQRLIRENQVAVVYKYPGNNVETVLGGKEAQLNFERSSNQRLLATQTIKNRLLSGTFVILDGFAFTDIARGFAQGLDMAEMLQREQGRLAPDLVVFLDLPPGEGSWRNAGRRTPGLDSIGYELSEEDAFKMMENDTWKKIPADGKMSVVASALYSVVAEFAEEHTVVVFPTFDAKMRPVRLFVERLYVQDEPVKVIVNFLPRDFTLNAFRELMGEQKGFLEGNLVRAKDPMQDICTPSYGFATYRNIDFAVLACKKLTGRCLEGAKFVRVTISRPREPEFRNTKICVRNIPAGLGASEVRLLFEKFGRILDFAFIRPVSAPNIRKAYILYHSRSEAEAAIVSREIFGMKMQAFLY